jgi:GTP 3',8-cyclase
MDMVQHFRAGHIFRLIEFMDVGSSNQWSWGRVVPGSTWLKLIHDRWSLRKSVYAHPGQCVRIVIVKFATSPTAQNPSLKCIN